MEFQPLFDKINGSLQHLVATSGVRK